jgi:hypothetical protein
MEFWEEAAPSKALDDTAVSETSARARLVVAQRALFRAMLRLKVTQHSAPDPGERLRAEEACWEAEAEVRDAWNGWRAEQGAELPGRTAARDSTPGTPQAVGSVPATAKLRFARWLVERGLLSELRRSR